MDVLVFNKLVPVDVRLCFKLEFKHIITPNVLYFRLVEQPEINTRPSVEISAVLFFPDFFVEEVGVELDGELLGQIGLALIEKRSNPGILIVDALFTVDLHDFSIAKENVPFRWEFPQLFLSHGVFEDDFISGYEIVVVPLHLSAFLHFFLRSGRFFRNNGALLHDSPFLLLVLLLQVLFFLVFILAKFSVEDVVDAFLDFAADVAFGGVLRPVLEAVEHVVLGGGPAADQQEGRHE